MSNFGFLRAEWPDLYVEAVHAERLAVADPRASCFYARRTLELAVTWLYQADSTLQRPYREDLAARIAEPTLVRVAGPGIRTKMDVIRRQGNAAVHRHSPVVPNDAIRVVTELFHVLYWVARTYSRNPADLPAPGLAFNHAAIPRPLQAGIRLAKQAELKARAEKYAAQDADLAAERRKNSDLDAELAALRAEIRAAKVANEARPDTHDYDEAETRSLIIDLLLKEAGWALDQPQDREYPVTGMPVSASPSGRGKVDYVLWDDDGRPLAVVEAKRTTRDPQQGKQQAKLYADCLENRVRPASGHLLHQRLPAPTCGTTSTTRRARSRASTPRKSCGCWSSAARAASPSPSSPINEQIAGRHYQYSRHPSHRRGLRERRPAPRPARHGDRFRQDAHRDRADRPADAGELGQARAVPRRPQGTGEPGRERLQAAPAERADGQSASPTRTPSGRVFVSTYPTMMNLINEMDGSGLRRFGPGYFDLIVIDEAHRSVYQKYGAIFDYFDALLVGLTATPKDEVDRNTYRLFHLEDGVPTDAYSLDEAVSEGYLVAAAGRLRAAEVPARGHPVRRPVRGGEGRLGRAGVGRGRRRPRRDRRADELNKWLFNADTVDKVLETLMANGLKVAGGDRLGKTIIFAKNNRARRVHRRALRRELPGAARASSRRSSPTAPTTRRA